MDHQQSGSQARARRRAGGLVANSEALAVRGVTYGTFARRGDGHRVPEPDQVDRDFSAMAELGLTAVRLYTVPPVDVVDLAAAHGLRLVVGLDYDDWRMVDGSDRRATERVLHAGLGAVERAMAVCAGRPEVLAVSVGNEVPVDLVRLHGIGRVERTLERLLDAVHRADPEMLATYTNYPSTEFLDPGGQDLVSWNVFLEDRTAFTSYLRHLLALAHERPLLLSEFGLSAGIHGERAQAHTIEWQLGALVASGAAGGSVFAWTDEWVVADDPVSDWDFGVTRADRSPKPAAEVLSRWPDGPAAAQIDLTTDAADGADGADGTERPLVSVVVCAYNESRHIDPCIESVLASTYPRVEVIVCDDGSTDDTAERAERHPVELLRLDHGGLSAARNTGARAATGEIVAYLDADAEAEPRWIEQLVQGFDGERVVAVGGPNHPYSDAPFVERAVAECPGNPREVLVGDDRAEHIAGCNMAFRRDVLLEVGGFDVAYRTAGDDVDLCWRLLDAGHEIAYAPTAAINHHRRGSVRGYLRQQRGYGRAERMLQGHHRDRFNRLGQARWRGFVYGGLSVPRRLLSSVVYHGSLGLEPFQPTRLRRGEAALATLEALLPLLVGAGLLVGGLGLALGSPLIVAVGLCLAAGSLVAVGTSAGWSSRHRAGPGRRLRFCALVAGLHVLQPFVRTWGRLSTRPLEEREAPTSVWRGDRLAFVDDVARRARRQRWSVRTGGESDAFDLELRRRATRARLNLAVVWSWTPRWAVRVRPRWGAVAATALVALAVVLTTSTPALVASGIAAVAISADLLWSRRRTTEMVRAITGGADLLPAQSADLGAVAPAPVAPAG